MWELLRKLHTEGKTILLTSHYLEEVENLCERVVIIKSGKLIADLSMKEVKDKGTLENLYLETVDTKEVNK
jgi:ABC-2 type transport system ATP-binding protein